MSAIVFDVESTGISEPHLIEAAWLRVPDPNNLIPTETFLQRYNPGKPIALGALATHHIMDEDLAECPPHTEFRLPDGVEYLVGYNIDYDWKVIGQPDVIRGIEEEYSKATLAGTLGEPLWRERVERKRHRRAL